MLEAADGDLTPAIVVGGDTVTTNTVATYRVTCDVTDSGGNSVARVSRTVIVQASVVGFTIPLEAGWNLISFPLATCSYAGDTPPAVDLPAGGICTPVNSIGDVLADIAGQYELIRSFDADEAHAYDPNLPG